MSETDRIERVWLHAADDDSWPPKAERDSFWGLRRSSHKWRPATDVSETEDSYRIVVEIAGMRGSDFAVTFEGQSLLIRGIRSDAGAHKAYHQMEISYGQFETAIQLPESVEVAEIEASYADGFLSVVLPKAQPKKVEIE
jgi:HSP20 family protein